MAYDLISLFNQDAAAKQYYNDLPSDIKRQVYLKQCFINTFDGLLNYAEHLLMADMAKSMVALTQAHSHAMRRVEREVSVNFESS